MYASYCMAVRRCFLCVLMVLVGLRRATPASSSCPPEYDHVYRPNLCFKLILSGKTRQEAKDACAAIGGMLAEPKDAEVNAYLRNLAIDFKTSVDDGFWLGITDERQEGRYVYESNGEDILFTDWDTTYYQPFGLPTHNCIVFYYVNTRWFEAPCAGWYFFPICQFGPLVDGAWTRFGPYSECSTTCGYGVQNRSRSCTNPAPQFGGRDCEGPAETTAACKDNPPCTDPCTVNPCKNGGTCINIDDNTRQCECPQYYTLPDCEPCSCWNLDDCDQARCVVILILYLMIVLISGVGAAIVVKLWINKKRNAGKAWTDKNQGLK